MISRIYQEELAKEEMPAWRFLYAMENHIIYHRGNASFICGGKESGQLGTMAGDG